MPIFLSLLFLSAHIHSPHSLSRPLSHFVSIWRHQRTGRIRQHPTLRLQQNDITMSTARFTIRHIPPLFCATAATFGGFVPLFNAEYAIRGMGLPQRISVSKPAQAIMIIGMARITAIGLALFTFYFQGKFEAVDTVMTTIGYVGLVDGYVCWKEGVPEKAVFRASSG